MSWRTGEVGATFLFDLAKILSPNIAPRSTPCASTFRRRRWMNCLSIGACAGPRFQALFRRAGPGHAWLGDGSGRSGRIWRAQRLVHRSYRSRISRPFDRRLRGRGRARSPVSGGLSPWQLRHALDFLLAHLDGDPTIAELAQECGLSSGYFARASGRRWAPRPISGSSESASSEPGNCCRREEWIWRTSPLACGLSIKAISPGSSPSARDAPRDDGAD